VTSDHDFTGVQPPVVGEEAEWFDHCREERLMIQRCASCGRHQFPPRSVCIECLEEEPEWVEAAGTGTVFTYTVQHREPPGFADQAPYAIAIIELSEGPRMLSRVTGKPDDVEIGMEVEVAWATAAPELQVPVFVPTGAADAG